MVPNSGLSNAEPCLPLVVGTDVVGIIGEGEPCPAAPNHFSYLHVSTPLLFQGNGRRSNAGDSASCFFAIHHLIPVAMAIFSIHITTLVANPSLWLFLSSTRLNLASLVPVQIHTLTSEESLMSFLAKASRLAPISRSACIDCLNRDHCSRMFLVSLPSSFPALGATHVVDGSCFSQSLSCPARLGTFLFPSCRSSCFTHHTHVVSLFPSLKFFRDHRRVDWPGHILAQCPRFF